MELCAYGNYAFNCLFVSVLCEFNFLCICARAHTSSVYASSFCKQLYSPEQLNEQANGVNSS